MAIQYMSKVDLAYQEIRRQILAGEIRPGERLLIQNLAQHLGTSAGPVRESFRRLEAEGLVTIQPHIGATVTAIGADEMWHAVLMLSALEGLATRLAADANGGLTAEELDSLDQLVASMDACIKNEHLEQFHLLNGRFHRTIYGASRVKRLVSFIDNLFQTVGVDSSTFEQIEDYAVHSNQEHAAILAALKEHHAVLAEERMKAHIEEAGRRRLSTLRH